MLLPPPLLPPLLLLLLPLLPPQVRRKKHLALPNKAHSAALIQGWWRVWSGAFELRTSVDDGTAAVSQAVTHLRLRADIHRQQVRISL
ncbi:hypothetical protein JKP88DRAFT_290944 [Tribonema minus]|uniref:Secreted protein n=1 Tax=Tribonema minus TaxID=303371 RepID=A0A835Z1S0_9STRA|nr:hypothetical protein JKP88DRAFT_290944 [Tribonema minus]